MRTTTRHRWRMRLPLPFSKGIERGGIVFTGGQCDLDEEGCVLHAGDTAEQIRATVANGLDVLGDLDIPAAQIVAARSFVVGLDTPSAQSVLRSALDRAGANSATASIVPLAALYYDGLVAETEFVAHPDASGGLCLQTIAGIETPKALGGRAAVTDLLTLLERRLQDTRLDRQGLLRLTFYWPDDITPEAFAAAAARRRDWFGNNAPVSTDLCVRTPRPRLEALFAANRRGAQERLAIQLPGSVEPDAVVMGNVLVTRGMTCRNGLAGILKQTAGCMDHLDAILSVAGFARTDIAKMSTYYVGGATAAELHDNLVLRAERFIAPGPASTGVPVPRLPVLGAKILIEAIAVKENA